MPAEIEIDTIGAEVIDAISFTNELMSEVSELSCPSLIGLAEYLIDCLPDQSARTAS